MRGAHTIVLPASPPGQLAHTSHVSQRTSYPARAPQAKAQATPRRSIGTPHFTAGLAAFMRISMSMGRQEIRSELMQKHQPDRESTTIDSMGDEWILHSMGVERIREDPTIFQNRTLPLLCPETNQSSSEENTNCVAGSLPPAWEELGRSWLPRSCHASNPAGELLTSH